jgi:hypothetical protein
MARRIWLDTFWRADVGLVHKGHVEPFVRDTQPTHAMCLMGNNFKLENVMTWELFWDATPPPPEPQLTEWDCQNSESQRAGAEWEISRQPEYLSCHQCLATVFSTFGRLKAVRGLKAYYFLQNKL